LLYEPDLPFPQILDALRAGRKLLEQPRSATARLPDFIEPMKAQLVDSMPAGDWIYDRAFSCRTTGHPGICQSATIHVDIAIVATINQQIVLVVISHDSFP
jgi:hypothetical protein